MYTIENFMNGIQFPLNYVIGNLSAQSRCSFNVFILKYFPGNPGRYWLLVTEGGVSLLAVQDIGLFQSFVIILSMISLPYVMLEIAHAVISRAEVPGYPIFMTISQFSNKSTSKCVISSPLSIFVWVIFADLALSTMI